MTLRGLAPLERFGHASSTIHAHLLNVPLQTQTAERAFWQGLELA